MKTLAKSLLFLFLTVISTGTFSFNASDNSDEATNTRSTKNKDWFSNGNSVIWLDQGISLSGKNRLVVERAIDGTKVLLPPRVLDTITSVIKNSLEASGISTHLSESTSEANALRIKTIITKYEAGSAGARWLAPGMGATICILRATIIDPMKNQSVGEIVSWRQVAAGGLFSAGADKYVPNETAESLADLLIQEIRK